jgi:hypothetical protein
MTDPISREYVLGAVLLGAGWSPGRVCLSLGISDAQLSQWEERLVFRLTVENWRFVFDGIASGAPPDPRILARLLTAAGVKSVHVDYPDGTIVSGDISNDEAKSDHNEGREIRNGT